VVNAPSSSPPTEDTADLTRAIEAIDGQHASMTTRTEPSPRETRGRLLRQLLITALCGLLVAGVMAVLGLRADDAKPANSADSRSGGRATVVFGNARSGNCLTWPDNAPDRPSFVLCRDDHLFEVADSVDMRDFQEPCQQTVRRYLGTHYDPDSRFTLTVLWPGNGDGSQSADRRLLCGLQLLGPNGQPVPFKGMIADLDQSKVWPPGTCLGIDSNRPTDIPVDCAAPHAAEVTGTVNLADRFQVAPPLPDQEAFIRDACMRMTDAYLAPVALPSTGLTLHYGTVSPASWSAGSRQVSCRIGAVGADQAWAPSTGSAKGPLTGDGPAAPPPEPTAAPSPEPTAAATTTPQTTSAPSPPATQSASPTPATTSASPTTSAPPPPPSPPSETTPPPNVLEIPGLPPITLPFPAPPPPEPAPPPPPPPPPPPAL